LSDPQTIGTALEVVRPALTGLVSDLFGLALADWVHEVKLRRLDLFQRHTKKLFAQRDAAERPQISPEALEQVIAAVSEAQSDDLIELWASLLATAASPERGGAVRPIFISTLRQFDPIDALVFRGLAQFKNDPQNRESIIVVATVFDVSQDAAEVSAEQLYKLGLLTNSPSVGLSPGVAPLGRELARALGLL